MSDIMRMMATGAAAMAREGFAYTKRYKDIGFTEAEFRLLTQAKPWTQSERLRIRGLLKEAVDASMTLAGLPEGTLPAEYVAAVICKLCHPVNRYQAASRAPDGFDVQKASGLREASQVELVTRERMLALVTAYSADEWLAVLGPPIYGSSEEDEKVRRNVEEQ